MPVQRDGEYQITYTYKGIDHTMRVYTHRLGDLEWLFNIRMPSGNRSIRKLKGRWQVTSPKPINDDLLKAIGEALNKVFYQ